MYAVIETGGKQYKVTEGDVIFVEKLEAQEGEAVTFEKVLAVADGDNVTVGTPVVAGAIDMVADGGLMTLGLNYYNLGYQTGEMAIRVIEDGADTATMPVESLVKYDYYFNGEMAQALGLEVPEQYAQYVQ